MATKTEVKALVELLEQDWQDVEDLAKALVSRLDELRGSKTRYVGVMQFGRRNPIYVGVGPYPGKRTAEKALMAHPAVADATARAIVPVISDEGYKALLADLDTPPESVLKENAASKKLANQRFFKLMNKEVTHIVVKNASDIKVVKR